MATLREELLQRIERLRFLGEEKLPPERTLAAELCVSRGTLRKELAALVREGRLIQRTGRGGGSFICTPAAEHLVEGEVRPPLVVTRSLNQVMGIPSILTGQGYTPHTKVLEAYERELRSEERDSLGPDFGDRVIVLRRIRSADDVPVSLEEMKLPASIVPGIVEHRLDSIYELIRETYGIRIARVEETITASIASATSAFLLETSSGVPLFDIARMAYDQCGRRVEVSRDLFRADVTRLTATSTV